MPYRLTPFINDGVYHVFNRGVEKRIVFATDMDYQRFLETVYYYQFSGPKPKFSNKLRFSKQAFDQNPKIVEIICYCLMPNHFHLMVRQLVDGGVQEFFSKVINSYTKYFNTKHTRVGHLFQGQFKSVNVDSDEQLVHVSRYIHLNPYVSELVKDLKNYQFSSYLDYIDETNQKLCVTEPVLALFKNKTDYQEFVLDHASYAQDIHKMAHLLLED